MPIGDHGTVPVPVPSMTSSHPKPKPFSRPTTNMMPKARAAVIPHMTKRRIQPAAGPAHSRAMNGSSTMVMGLMPIERVVRTTAATPQAAEAAGPSVGRGRPARRAQ